MGCDIHDVLQVKKNGQWVTVATDIFDGRSYLLFGILSGVRGWYVNTISEPKGLPDDFIMDKDSDENHAGCWMGNHSYSWLTFKEMNDRLHKTKLPEEYEILASLLIKCVNKLPEDSKKIDFRYVFGFDS